MREVVRDLVGVLAEQAAELQRAARRERDQQVAAGQDAAGLDRYLVGIESILQDVDDMKVTVKIGAIVDEQGPGPYRLDELAALIGEPRGRLEAMLDQLVSVGLVNPPDDADPSRASLSQ